MNWLNIRLATLHAPEFIGSDPVARATWLSVSAYCAEQENGGVIAGAKSWKDRQWQQTCGVTLAEVEASGKLLIWDGDALIAWNYPTDKEHEVKLRREGGKIGGNRSGKARKKLTFAENRSSPSMIPSGNPSGIPLTEGEREGEVERKEKIAPRGLFEGLPEELDTAEFRQVWQSFLAYRKRRKFTPLLPESIAIQWRKMASWGVGLAITQIEETIGNNWQGVFAPKANAIPAKIKPLPLSPDAIEEMKEASRRGFARDEAEQQHGLAEMRRKIRCETDGEEFIPRPFVYEN